MNDRNSLSKGKKIVIISMLSIIALLLVMIAIILSLGDFNISRNNIRGNSRTVMIYMAGSNLESNSRIASSDLSKIIPNSIDINKTKVLVYTGGTKKWHNFVNSNENAIYELKQDGFNKVMNYSKSSLGSSNSLSEFLNYGYTNYKTDKYDLIFWNHGLGALGSISDENTNDYLDLSEISSAFKNSPFNDNNKLDTIVFRTCLNATIEVASILYPYSNYMVASEEVTLGKTGYGVLNFLNEVPVTSTGIEYGKTFISSYQKQISDIDIYGTTDSTYSIIDLSKITKLISMIDDYFSTLDVDKNYAEISRIRANMDQYGVMSSNVSDYDTVDLYELLGNLKNINSSASNIQKYIKNDVIVYNWATNNHSNGISIYLPYTSSETAKRLHFSVYEKVAFSDNYKNFIFRFNDNQNSSTYSFNYDLSDNEFVKKGNEFKLKLTEEQIENYSKSGYIILKKEDDGQFMPVYKGLDSKIDKDGYITTNIDNNILTTYDKDDKKDALFTYYQVKSNGDYTEYTVPVFLNKIVEGELPTVDSANMHIKVDKKNKIHIGEIYLVSSSKEDAARASGTVVDLKDYSSIDFLNFRYNITDENGNYSSDWSSKGVLYMLELKVKDLEFKMTSLDNENDYYCVFIIQDIQNKTYYSNLISIK